MLTSNGGPNSNRENVRHRHLDTYSAKDPYYLHSQVSNNVFASGMSRTKKNRQVEDKGRAHRSLFNARISQSSAVLTSSLCIKLEGLLYTVLGYINKQS